MTVVIIVQLEVVLVSQLLAFKEGPEVADDDLPSFVLLAGVDDSDGLVLVPFTFCNNITITTTIIISITSTE